MNNPLLPLLPPNKVTVHDDEEAPIELLRLLDDGDQEHRRAEREALLEAFKADLLKHDAATLEMIRPRWVSGILNQLHVGSWDSIWNLLDAAYRVRGFCTSGTVTLGLLDKDQESVDLNTLTEPPKELLDVLGEFRFYVETLKRSADLNDALKAGDQAVYIRVLIDFYKWLEKHRGRFPFLSNAPVDEIPDSEVFAETFAKKSVADLPPLILNTLVNLESRLFMFRSSPEDPAAGWRKFFEFTDDYSRLPDPIIKKFGKCLFKCHVGDSSGS